MKTWKKLYHFLGVALAFGPLAASAQTYTWTTVAGLAGNTGTNNGTGGSARFTMPTGITVDSAGNVYVADNGNDLIRELTQNGTNWNVTTIAGSVSPSLEMDGTGTSATFISPNGITADSGNPPFCMWPTSTVRVKCR